MGGKLKITGNILAAQKLQQIWIENSSKEFASMQENKKVSTYDDEQDRALIEVSAVDTQNKYSNIGYVDSLFPYQDSSVI